MVLTNPELEVMQALWRLGECAAPDVHRLVSAERDVTYSTVKTMIDRLEKKQAIERVRVEGRTIYIRAAIKPEQVEATMVDRLVNGLFGGDRRPMFTNLLNDDSLTAEDLDYVEALIAKRRRNDGREG